MAKDYYKTLGVPKESTEQEIKRAYRKLALKYHPDKASEENKKEYEQKFKEISEAYRILSDKGKRSQYDQFGQNFEGSPFGQGFSQRDFSSFYNAFGGKDNFEDLGFDKIFEEIFGFSQRRSNSRVVYGDDIVVDLEIKLEDAFHGIKKEIELSKMIVCSECKGKGGESIKKCPHCQGSGYEQVRSQSLFGFFIQQKPCSKCHGRGEIPEKTCKKCRGEGRVREIEKIKIAVPAGIENGQTLKLSGQGEAASYGGNTGDLFANIHIPEHKNFQRQGSNLYYNLVIHFSQAALGDRIEIEGIDGKLEVKIPAGIQPGELIRLKSKGMPSLYQKGRGDLIVKIQVQVPKKISREQKKLIEQLKELN